MRRLVPLHHAATVVAVETAGPALLAGPARTRRRRIDGSGPVARLAATRDVRVGHTPDDGEPRAGRQQPAMAVTGPWR